MHTEITKTAISLHRSNSEAKARPILATSAAVLMVAFAATFSPVQAATIVTTPGVDVTFDTEPAPTEWATFNDGGAAGDVLDAAGMDARVSGFFAANIIDPIPPSFASPRAAGATTEYDATAQNIQTRPTGVGTHVLMATLQNGSGAPATTLQLAYDLGVDAPLPETLQGHRVYFSLDGTAWTNIPEISGIGAAGRLSTSVELTNWANGAQLFLLWTDDNGSSSPDTGFSLDNFRFAAAQTVVGRNLIYNRSHTVGGAPDGNLATAGNYFLDGNTATAFAANDVANFSQDGNTTITVPADIQTGGVVVSHNTGTYTIGGAGRITGALTKSNAGTVVFTSANDFTRTTLSGGTMVTQAATTLGTTLTVSATGGTLQTDADTSAGRISGTGPLTKTGTGALILTGGGGDATGGITVQAGKVSVSDASSLGGATQAVNLNGTTLEFTNGGDTTLSDAVNTRKINIGAAGATIAVTAPGSPVNPGAIGVVIGANDTLVGTAGTITKTGDGALRVRADNPSLASNWVVAAGYLESEAVTALGTGTVTVNALPPGSPPGTPTPTLAGRNSAVSNNITLNGGNLGTRTGDATDYTGAVNVAAASGFALNSFSTPANPQNIAVSGVLSGSADLVLNTTVVGAAGTKALLLNNTGNTYTGTITVGDGTGLAGIGNTRGAVNVNALGTLGAGSISDAAVSTTFGPGALSIGGNLSLVAGAVFSADISGADPAPIAGTDYDQIIVGTGTGPTSTGTVSLGGSDLVLTLGFGVVKPSDIYFIIANDGIDPVLGTFNNLPDGSTVLAGSESFFISYNANAATGTFIGGNDVALMPIPEPASAGLLFLGSALLLRRRRRHV